MIRGAVGREADFVSLTSLIYERGPDGLCGFRAFANVSADTSGGTPESLPPMASEQVTGTSGGDHG